MAKKRSYAKMVKEKNRKINHYKGFFAFPGEPSDRRNIIEKAINAVNEKTHENRFKIISWTDINKTSSRIISNIMESINKSDILIADISDLNPNVLFEVGFAFGLGKKLLLFTQGFSSNDRQKDIDDIELIRGLNIDSYENLDQLADKILSNVPDIFLKREAEIYKYGYNPNISYNMDDRGFFLKGITNHQNALVALSIFRSIFSNCVIDDWVENISQTLMFYIREIAKASGIVALFVPSSWDNSRKVNARFSFICGMALGMHKNVLMVGLPGYKTPFDYKEIMVIANDEENIKKIIYDKFTLSIAQPTINQLSPDLARNDRERISDTINQSSGASSNNKQAQPSSNKQAGELLSKEEKEIILIDVNLGNSVAENEEFELPEYYIETGQYQQAMKSKQAIIVGTKGSGKTACFYKIRDHLRNNHPQNLVCEIKPSDYKMERFLESLKILGEGKGLIGHVLENVWKMVVYCSLLENIGQEIEDLPSFLGLTQEESRLMQFILKHSELINSPFEQKLEKACAWLHDVSHNVDNFSRKIHDEFLSEAKSALLPILRNKKRVVILLDNLDKAWEVNSNLKLQAQLIFNLLGIHRRLYTDFNIDDVSVLIFLRRNIFEYIAANIAREPDKLSADTIELLWNDKDVLLRVLEERFLIASDYWKRDVDNVWETFFRWGNTDISLKDWLYESVLPRPRDMINYIQKSIEIAINREHSEIQEIDLQDALNSYSGFALNQIITEYKAEEPWITDFLNSFTGENNIFSYSSLIKKIKMSCPESLSYEQLINRIITLVSIHFMGVRINGSTDMYACNLQESNKLKSIIRNSKLSKKIHFVIHPVFHRHLNIEKNENLKIRFFDKFKYLITEPKVTT